MRVRCLYFQVYAAIAAFPCTRIVLATYFHRKGLSYFAILQVLFQLVGYHVRVRHLMNWVLTGPIQS